MDRDVLKIRCLHCGKWMDSPIVLRGETTFDTSTLIGNKVQCRNCGKMTECNKENMKWDHWEDNEKTMGFRGKDTF